MQAELHQLRKSIETLETERQQWHAERSELKLKFQQQVAAMRDQEAAKSGQHSDEVAELRQQVETLQQSLAKCKAANQQLEQEIEEQRCHERAAKSVAPMKVSRDTLMALFHGLDEHETGSVSRKDLAQALLQVQVDPSDDETMELLCTGVNEFKRRATARCPTL